MQNCNEPWAENDDKCQKKLLTNVNEKAHIRTEFCPVGQCH
jgi:hypothetical protein